jgi:hypothetical protein
MGNNSDKSQNKGQKTDAETPKAPASETAPAVSGKVPPAQIIDSTLPMVEAPKLDNAEPMMLLPSAPLAAEPPKPEAIETPPASIEAAAEGPSEASDDLSSEQEPASEAHVVDAVEDAADEAAAPAAESRPSRFMLLAASVAIAAALGSFTGSLSGNGVARYLAAPSRIEQVSDLPKAMKAELSALKVKVESATINSNSQFAKIAERLDRVEHAAADPAAKLAHIADTLDRLDKRNAAAAEATGSIAGIPQAAAEPNLPDRVVEGWVVQNVANGRALVSSRFGGVFEVGPGSFIPGLGRVDVVKRQDGQWMVVTARGVIVSAH